MLWCCVSVYCDVVWLLMKWLLNGCCCILVVSWVD